MLLIGRFQVLNASHLALLDWVAGSAEARSSAGASLTVLVGQGPGHRTPDHPLLAGEAADSVRAALAARGLGNAGIQIVPDRHGDQAGWTRDVLMRLRAIDAVRGSAATSLRGTTHTLWSRDPAQQQTAQALGLGRLRLMPHAARPVCGEDPRQLGEIVRAAWIATGTRPGAGHPGDAGLSPQLGERTVQALKETFHGAPGDGAAQAILCLRAGQHVLLRPVAGSEALTADGRALLSLPHTLLAGAAARLPVSRAAILSLPAQCRGWIHLQAAGQALRDHPRRSASARVLGLVQHYELSGTSLPPVPGHLWVHAADLRPGGLIDDHLEIIREARP